MIWRYINDAIKSVVACYVYWCLSRWSHTPCQVWGLTVRLDGAVVGYGIPWTLNGVTVSCPIEIDGSCIWKNTFKVAKFYVCQISEIKLWCHISHNQELPTSLIAFCHCTLTLDLAGYSTIANTYSQTMTLNITHKKEGNIWIGSHFHCPTVNLHSISHVPFFISCLELSYLRGPLQGVSSASHLLRLTDSCQSTYGNACPRIKIQMIEDPISSACHRQTFNNCLLGKQQW